MPATTNGSTTTPTKSGLHELLTPDNCCVIFIDHQPAMTFGVANIDRQTLLNNVVGFAKGAKVFNIPVILTAVESASFSGAIWPQLTSVFPDTKIIERSSMNSWEDAALVRRCQGHWTHQARHMRAVDRGVPGLPQHCAHWVRAMRCTPWRTAAAVRARWRTTPPSNA